MSFRRRAFAASLAVAFFAAALCQAQPQARPDAKREQLRARIEKLRAELADTEGDRDEAREELRDSERAISEANRALRELSSQRERVRRDGQGLAARKRQMEADLVVRERELGRLLNAIYRGGDPGVLKTLLSGEDPNQTARNLHYLGYLSRAQLQWMAALRTDLAKLQALESSVRETSEEIRSLEQAQKTQRSELLHQQEARRRVLQQISLRLQTQRRQVKSLQADEERLSRLVDRIAKAITPETPPARSTEPPRPVPENSPFAGIRGSLRLPVKGAVTHRFGAARPEGGPPWKGMFIEARQGTEVRAAAPGQVVFAEWMRGYGNLLILDHGNGYLTIYGNNESLLRSVGDTVGAGDAVATVGVSGGAQQTGLYFEARHEGKAVDPMRWMTMR